MMTATKMARTLAATLLLPLAVLLLMACDRQTEDALHEPLQEAAERAAERTEELVEGLAADDGEEPAEGAGEEEGEDEGDEQPEGSEAESDEQGSAAPAADGAMAMGSDHETIEVDESELVAQPGASMGDAALCPVSGEAFRVRDTSPSAEHDGETYYFCCGSCVRPFLRNPDQYLTAAAE